MGIAPANGRRLIYVSTNGFPITRRVVMLYLLAGLQGAAAQRAFAEDVSNGGADGEYENSSIKNTNDDQDDDDKDLVSGKSDGDDDDRIRDAVRRGEAAPLRDILSTVRKSYGGKIVSIRLTGSGDRMVYRIRILDGENRLIELRVNARTGKITAMREI